MSRLARDDRFPYAIFALLSVVFGTVAAGMENHPLAFLFSCAFTFFSVRTYAWLHAQSHEPPEEDE